MSDPKPRGNGWLLISASPPPGLSLHGAELWSHSLHSASGPLYFPAPWCIQLTWPRFGTMTPCHHLENFPERRQAPRPSAPSASSGPHVSAFFAQCTLQLPVHVRHPHHARADAMWFSAYLSSALPTTDGQFLLTGTNCAAGRGSLCCQPG